MVHNYGSGGVNNNTFPSQKLTEKEKIKKYGSVRDWAISVIDYIESSAHFDSGNKLSTLDNKKKVSVNLKLAEQGVFDMNLVLSLLEPYTDVKDFKKRFPDIPTHYDIVSPRLSLIRGEEINRPFNFIAINRSSDNVSQAQKMRSNLVYNVALQMFARELEKALPNGEGMGSIPSPPMDEGGNPITTVEAVNKYINYSYSGIGEKVANDLLKYLIQELGLEYSFNNNFLKYLATGSEIYFIGEEGNNPSVRIVDPLLFDCEKSSGDKFIEDCSWAREIRYLTAPEVYDLFWEELKDDDVDNIEGNKGIFGFDNFMNDLELEHVSDIEGDSSSLVRVARFEWQSLKKIGILYRVDPTTLEVDKEIINEDTLVEDGSVVNWYWVNERWEGYKVGNLYLRIRPLLRQYNTIDDLFKNNSSYVGIKEPYSFLDRIIPYQYMFNVVMHKIKLNLARDHGPAFIMDIAQIPKTNGWTLDKWFHVLDTMGVAIINSYDEYKDVHHTFNQFAMVDRSTAQSTQYYISILDFIIRFVADITGITKQREGQMQARETASGIERSVTQSTAITEPWFYTHNEVKRRVLNRLIDESKNVYKDNQKIVFVLDDLSKKFIDISDDFKLSEFGIFITNSSFDLKILETLKQVSQISLQQKEITLKDFITSMKTQSVTEIEQILDAAEKYNQRKQQEMQEMQNQASQQMEQMRIQQQQQMFQMQMEMDKTMETIKSDNAQKLQEIKNSGAIEVAKINAEARITSFRTDVDVDSNDNTVPDVIEREKIAFEREKLNVDRELKSRELDLKEKQLNKPIQTNGTI